MEALNKQINLELLTGIFKSRHKSDDCLFNREEEFGLALQSL